MNTGGWLNFYGPMYHHMRKIAFSKPSGPLLIFALFALAYAHDTGIEQNIGRSFFFFLAKTSLTSVVFSGSVRCDTRVCRGETSPGAHQIVAHHIRKCGGGELHKQWSECQKFPLPYNIGNWATNKAVRTSYETLVKPGKKFYMFCDWPREACKLMEDIFGFLDFKNSSEKIISETFIVLREPVERWYSSYKFFRAHNISEEDFRLCNDYYVRWLQETNYFEQHQDMLRAGSLEIVDAVAKEIFEAIPGYAQVTDVLSNGLQTAISRLSAYPVVCMLDRMEECNYFLKKYLKFDNCMLEPTRFSEAHVHVHKTSGRFSEEPASFRAMAIAKNVYDVVFFDAALKIYDAQIFLERQRNSNFDSEVRALAESLRI